MAKKNIPPYYIRVFQAHCSQRKKKNNLKHLWKCSEEIIEKWPKEKGRNNFKHQSLAAHLHKDCEHFTVGHSWAPFMGTPNEQIENELSDVSPVQMRMEKVGAKQIVQ